MYMYAVFDEDSESVTLIVVSLKLRALRVGEILNSTFASSVGEKKISKMKLMYPDTHQCADMECTKNDVKHM